MEFLDVKIREKIGFNYVMENLCISSVYGRAMLKNIEPIKNKAELLKEYDNIEKVISIIKNEKYFYNFIDLLKRFKDIRNTFKRVKNGELLDEVELFEIKNYVILLAELKELYEAANVKAAGIVINDFLAVFLLLNPQGTKTLTFYIYEEYSLKLKEIRACKIELEQRIYREKEKTEQLLKARISVVNEEKAEELIVRKKISSKLKDFAEELLDSTFYIGKLDMLIAKAKLAVDYEMCKPILKEEVKLNIKSGINPIAKAEVLRRGGRFYPISLEVSSGSCIITGANMGGKTVALSIVTLNYLLAYMGFYAFAQAFEFYPLDFIYFLSEDGQSIENGLSSFGSEVLGLKEILHKLKKGTGLVILDEFARGTNPAEGSKLTKALVKYLNKFSSISILSTHYDGVAQYSKLHYQVMGLKNVDFNALKQGKLDEKNFLKLINSLMDYTLEKVDNNAAVPKDAVRICSLLGLDEEIINALEEE